MQQKLALGLLTLLPFLSTLAIAEVITIQDPITGCTGNSYCTGFEVCGAGHCHRRESCGTWGGKTNSCCYTVNSTETCEAVAGPLLESFSFASGGTEATYGKSSCPAGTGDTTYDAMAEQYLCCPMNTTIVIEVAPQNATFLDPDVPLEDKYQTIVTALCVGGSEDSSAPSATTGTGTGTSRMPTGTSSSSSGTTTPNSANSNGVPALLGLSIVALVLGIV